MRPPARRAISAIILAGGRGARMGKCDKARLQWRGKSLLQQLVQQLRPHVAHITIVRSRRRSSLRPPSGVRLCSDAQAYAGPSGGLLAGLDRSRTAWCLCLPVDSLNPPANLIGQLARNSRHGAYAHHQGDHYYLHQLIARQQRHKLRQFHNHGGRSVGNACRELGQTAVPFTAHGTTWSINTTMERRRAQRSRMHMRRRPLQA